MTRLVLTLAAAVATAAIVLVPAYGTTATLTGEVGPGFSIEVKKGNKDLEKIKAGTYKLKVEDKAAIHNFHLVGPGVAKTTGVAFTGTKTWTVKLKVGKYTYICDPHAAVMKGSFTVTA